MVGVLSIFPAVPFLSLLALHVCKDRQGPQTYRIPESSPQGGSSLKGKISQMKDNGPTKRGEGAWLPGASHGPASARPTLASFCLSSVWKMTIGANPDVDGLNEMNTCGRHEQLAQSENSVIVNLCCSF